MSLLAVESELTRAVERLAPSVVRVERRGARRLDPTDPRSPGGTGSGFVLDARGFVVTNDHVVRGARSVAVALPDGDEVEASVVGEDPLTDVALLRVDGRRLPAARLGDSAALKVGQFALAIGNSLGLPGEPTVSFGVVSALGRPLPGTDFIFEGLIQTDAPINPGNSGGPLANLDGEVIGVNTAVVPFAAGVGFAVPSNTVRSIAEQIRSVGRVVRPWLGISAVPLTPALARRFNVGRTEGILVAEVARRGPAERAGLRPGDVLLVLASRPVRSLKELLSGLAPLPIGGAVDAVFDRSGAEMRTVVRVVEGPVPAA